MPHLKLLECVVADLVVDGRQSDWRAPTQRHRVRRHLLRAQLQNDVLRPNFLVDSLGQTAESIVSPENERIILP